MLYDDVYPYSLAEARRRKNLSEGQEIARPLKRYYLAPDVVKLTSDLMQDIDPYIGLPFPDWFFWFECDLNDEMKRRCGIRAKGTRLGFNVMQKGRATGEADNGNVIVYVWAKFAMRFHSPGIFVIKPRDIMGSGGKSLFEIPGYKHNDIETDKVLADPVARVLCEHVRVVDPIRATSFIKAVVATLNTPRFLNLEEIDVSRLNALRKQRGDAELVPYLKATLSIWGRDASKGTAAEQVGDDSGRQASGKRRHRVRNFLRVRRQKIELVHAHWRGNAALGTVSPMTTLVA